MFDGQRFCQHLEGPTAVEALMGRIAADERHSELRIAYEGPLAERRYRFDMGYAQAEDPMQMEHLAMLRGDDALQKFLALRPSLDIQSHRAWRTRPPGRRRPDSGLDVPAVGGAVAVPRPITMRCLAWTVSARPGPGPGPRCPCARWHRG